jgi:hypothetical protein
MIPDKSLPMIASSENSTMAASCAAATSIRFRSVTSRMTLSTQDSPLKVIVREERLNPSSRPSVMRSVVS